MRDRLLDLLARLMADGLLTSDEADTLIRQYDAGELTLRDVGLPLSPEEGVGGLTEAAIAAGLASVGETSRVIQRERAAGDFRDRYVTAAQALALRYAGPDASISEWQAAFKALVDEAMVTSALLGLGAVDPPADLLRWLNEESMLQAAYLSRFADTVALRRVQANPMSAEGMAARAALYGGAAWAVYWLAQSFDQRRGEGWVVRYVARDDGSTCSRCSAAVGWYRPENAPLPGKVCLGGGRCRCRWEWRYDPDLYARLG